MNVIVIGSGLLGLTSAYYLASHGHRVRVVERQPGPALETSYANGGLLTPSLSDPWNAPGVFWNMLKWIGREDSPLLMRPRALPSLAFWGLKFLGHSTRERYQRNILRNTRMGIYNLRMMEQLRSEIGLSSLDGGHGTLKICRQQQALEHAAEMADFLSTESIRFEVLDRQGVFSREPALKALGDKVAGAVYFPDDQFGDAHQFCCELTEASKVKGVEFLFNTSVAAFQTQGSAVTGLHTDRGLLEADAIVLAAGSYSPVLAKTAGLNLPIRPCKGYSVTLPVAGWKGGPKIPVIDDALHAGVIPLGDRLRVAGTAEFNGYDTRLNQGRLDNLFHLLEEIYPQAAPYLDRSQAESWAGLRPVSASGVPLLGRTRVANLYLNTGHGHLGWSMAAGSGKAVADLISGQRPEIPLDDYSLAVA